MIKSPLTSPLRPALTSPYELISRSVFELNGTQWGELSEPVVISTSEDFEFELVAQITKPTGLFFFEDSVVEGDNERLNINGSGELVCKFSGIYRNLGAVPSLVTNKISTYVIRRVGDTFTYSVDGVTHISATVPTGLIIQKMFRGFEGVLFNQKIWTNGDRNTGDLILDIPFDESGSDYQRNRAVALGAELVTNGDFSEGLIGWSFFSAGGGASDGIISTAVNGAEIARSSTDSFLAADYKVVDPTKKYLLSFEIVGEDAAFGVRRGGYDFAFLRRYSEGKHGTLLGAEHIYDGKIAPQFWPFNPNTTSKVRNVSISEWSGVILQNALPEDWTQIERKRWWNYWLGPELRISPSNPIDSDIFINGDTSSGYAPCSLTIKREVYATLNISAKLDTAVRVHIDFDSELPVGLRDSNGANFPRIYDAGTLGGVVDFKIEGNDNIAMYATSYGEDMSDITGKIISIRQKLEIAS